VNFHVTGILSVLKLLMNVRNESEKTMFAHIEGTVASAKKLQPA